MSDYGSRSDISPIERAGTRAPTPVAPVQPIATRPEAGEPAVTRSAPVVSTDVARPDDEVAGAAEYANIHARIAVIMADLRSSTDAAAAVSGAEGQITSMLPAPVVLVPLPPASKAAVEHAANVAKRLVLQASYAHAAQANVRRGTVDQMLSIGA